MTYIIFDSLIAAQTLNKEINDYMISNVEGYNATRWCEILTDNNGNYSVYIKSLDSRQPLLALDSVTKAKIIEKLPDSFYTDKENTGIMLKTPNYVK